MNYQNIVQGEFISRPNRFIAHVMVGGKVEICHVKNTGRCKELLISGARVFLEKSDNPNRKTKYSLIAVYKGDKLINMDSQVPNKVVKDFLPYLFPDLILVKPEYKFGDSRIDLYLETPEDKILIEVKGVTLEEKGIAMFPDAPTLRGIKHLKELSASISLGYKAYVFFLIQMEGIEYFTPNYTTHKEFGEELKLAEKAGVNILAFDSLVTPTSININEKIPIRL